MATPEQRKALDQLKSLLDELRQPLTKSDRAAGWTEKQQETMANWVDGIREGLKVAVDYDHSSAPFHITRWLDGAGIGHAPGERKTSVMTEIQLVLKTFG